MLRNTSSRLGGVGVTNTATSAVSSSASGASTSPTISRKTSNVTVDGSFDVLTDEEKQLKESVNQFRQDILTRARIVIHTDLPKKILEMDKLFKDLHPPTHEEHLRYFQDLLQRQLEEHPVPSKKRKLDGDSAHASADVYLQAIPSYPSILESFKLLRQEVLHLIELFNTVKIWIQLNIPAIEDGNNFGVSIQEETVNELARAEESCYSVMDAVAKFYATRGKLMTKLIKYPRVQDYIMSAVELDVKECVNLRLCAIDLRNNCAIIHDLITKNLEKIKKPKSSNMQHLY